MRSATQKPEATVRDVLSILEVIDVETGLIQTLHTFDHCVEAPNWTQNGAHLVYNDRGGIYTFAVQTGEIRKIDTGFANRCNNDHVLSPDGRQIAVSHHAAEDGKSRIYILPFSGGQPVMVTPLAPSYLHGWSPDGKTLAYCAERDGEYDVYTIPVEGGGETRLTDTPGLNDGPEYTPDGQFIWLKSVRSGLM